MTEPYCTRPDCHAPNHCPVHGVHHPVDSMVRWCASKVRLEVAS